MTLPRFDRILPGQLITCPACTLMTLIVDSATGLCIECWRPVVLAPAALAGWFADLETRELLGPVHRREHADGDGRLGAPGRGDDPGDVADR